ncbi:HAMP domain-containing sensor histidine kinase [Brevibacillus sp. NRS-1366]|uniref:HAMP domain-containing sensor histidine kinase n=1 Tax=Brevibacillus sp. NRS-1366 TaxID=3233899 RepID=UPI003D1A95CA
MFIKRTSPSKTPVPLLRYWTWRYAMILSIMLFGIGFFGIYWINKNATEQQFAVLEARTQLLADSYSKVALSKVIKVAPMTNLQPAIQATPASTAAFVATIMPDIPTDHVVQISGETTNNQIKQGITSANPSIKVLLPAPVQPADNKKETREIITLKDATWLRVGVPYYEQNAVAGTYYVSTRLNNDLVHTYITIMVSIGIITLCGWGIVYVLSRSLTQPLRQLALAAEQISAGNYEPSLPDASLIKEAEISQLIVSFDEMANRLGQLERMRTDLLAGVSHELRTPVTSIRGMIQAVKDGVVSGADAEEFMQISMDEAKRLQTMVNDLLDFSSMEAGAVHTEKKAINLSDLLDQLIAQVRTLPAFANIEVSASLEPPHLVWIGDESHFKQILFNLLGNSAAAKATRIEIKAEQQSDQLSIDVTDNGKGIPEAEAPFIFERYYRGDSKRKKKYGLGLGLTICRLLAKTHGGNVELIQSSPTGTVFRLTLGHPPGPKNISAKSNRSHNSIVS